MNYNRESLKKQMICETVTPLRFQIQISDGQILRGFSPGLPLFLHLADAKLSPFQFARKMFFLAPWLEAANEDDLEIVRTSSRAWRNAWTRRDFFQSFQHIYIYIHTYIYISSLKYFEGSVNLRRWNSENSKLRAKNLMEEKSGLAFRSNEIRNILLF